jgi:hypothetical protein
MTIEVAPEEFGKDLDRAYRKIAQQVRIPGFRKKGPPADHRRADRTGGRPRRVPRGLRARLLPRRAPRERPGADRRAGHRSRDSRGRQTPGDHRDGPGPAAPAPAGLGLQGHPGGSAGGGGHRRGDRPAPGLAPRTIRGAGARDPSGARGRLRRDRSAHHRPHRGGSRGDAPTTSTRSGPANSARRTSQSSRASAPGRSSSSTTCCPSAPASEPARRCRSRS